MKLRGIITFVVYMLGLPLPATAQADYDKAYIENHTNDLTLRTYGGYKFAGYNVGQRGFGGNLPYRSNDNFNIGVGFSYRDVGLNLGIKAPFVNNDDDKFGKTSFIDFQTLFYLRKWLIDLNAQLYKGFYLIDDKLMADPLPKGNYYIRPDLQTGTLGFNLQYIFNHRRFSYRAAYVQSECQKKSAGSFIVGGGAHLVHTRADSSIVPSQVADKDFFNGYPFNKSVMLSVAVSGGYAQTWIIKKHFFVSASAVGSIGVNHTQLSSKEVPTKNGGGLHINYNLRMAAGYNSSQYYAGLQFVDFSTRNFVPIQGAWQESRTGSMRIVVARRFKAKKYKLYEMYEKMLIQGE